MRKKIVMTMAMLVAICVSAAFAMSDSEKNKLVKKLSSTMPNWNIDSIQESPVKGMYQINVGNKIYYVTQDQNYMIYGQLFDLNNQDKSSWNLTEQARQQAMKPLLESLNPKDMIVYTPKQTKATITVFTDPSCGYCKKLHSELSQLMEEGIEVRYVAFPRAGLNSGTYKQMVSAWCSDNPQEAFNMIKSGQNIPEKVCKNPIADQYKLGQKLGITGTPTIVFGDGTMQPGYSPAPRLAKQAILHKKS